MTNTTLVTAAQLATAQTRAIDIANLAKVVAPTATFKFLALLDGTRNIASNPAYSRDAQPTSIGQLSIQLKTLQDQGLLPSNAGYSYRAGVGTPGTQAGSALNPTQQAENTAKEVYKEYAEAAYEWRQDNPGGDITAMMVSFSRGNYTATIFAQKLYVEGLVYTDPNTGVKTELIRPGGATITTNLAISPVNTFGQGASGLPPNVLNTVAIIAGTENRAGFIQADLSTSGATNIVISAGHGDAADVYLNSIGIVFQPAYQNLLSNAGYPLPILPPANVTGPLYIHQERATSLGTLPNLPTTTPGKLVSVGPAPIVIPTDDGGTVTQFEYYKGDIYIVKQFGGVTASVTKMQPGGINPVVTHSNPNPITMTDGQGNSVTRGVNNQILQTTVKQAGGELYQTNYNNASQVTSIGKTYPVASDGSQIREAYAADGVTLTGKVIVQLNGDYTATRYINGQPGNVQTKVSNPDGSNTVSQYDGSGSNLQSSLTAQRDGSYTQNLYDSNRNLTSQSVYSAASNSYTDSSYSGGLLQQSVVSTQAGNATLYDSLDATGRSLGTSSVQTFDDTSRLETTTTPDGKVVQKSFDVHQQLTGTITDTPDGLGGTNRAVTTIVDGKEVQITQYATAAALVVDSNNDGDFIDAGDFDTTDIDIDGQDALDSDLIEHALDNNYQSAQEIIAAAGTDHLSQLITAADASDADGFAPVQGYSDQAGQETAWYSAADAKDFGSSLQEVQSLVAALKLGNPLPIAVGVFNFAAKISRNPELGTFAGGLNVLASLQGLRGALERGDELGALVSGSYFVKYALDGVRGVLGEQIVSRYGSVAAARIAIDQGDELALDLIGELDGLSAALDSIAQGLPYLNLINAISKGDEVGLVTATLAILAQFPAYAWAGPVGWAIAGIQLFISLFGGGDDAPDIRGNGVFAANGDGKGVHSVLTAQGADGGGASVVNAMDSLLAGLQTVINTQLPASDWGIIASRLPWLSFTGYAGGGGTFTMSWNDNQTGAVHSRSFNADGDYIASSDAAEIANSEEFFKGMGQQFVEIATGKFKGEAALVNGWEAQTAQAQANWGHSLAGMNTEQRARAQDQWLGANPGDAAPGNAGGVNASSRQNARPIVLDLDGNGITVTSRAQGGSVMVDVDDDGFAEETDWINPRDAMLVIDKNDDGKISGGAEMFNDAQVNQAARGLNVLQALDANGDNTITAADYAFSHLRVWQDINHDGVAQSYELASLGAKGISELNFGAGLFVMGGVAVAQRIPAQIVTPEIIAACAQDMRARGRFGLKVRVSDYEGVAQVPCQMRAANATDWRAVA